MTIIATGNTALAMFDGLQRMVNLRAEADAIAAREGLKDEPGSLQADAFRHAYTSAEITRRFGEDIARMGGNAVAKSRGSGLTIDIPNKEKTDSDDGA